VFKLFIFTVVKTEKCCFKQNNAWYAVVSICFDTVLNCTKFKIIENAATRCHSLKLKCTEFYLVWGSPRTPLGKLIALTQAPCWCLLLREGRMGRKGKEEDRGRESRESRESSYMKVIGSRSRSQEQKWFKMIILAM